jgi:hypothetical protein
VVRAQLVGKGELYGDLHRPGSVDDLLVALREDFAGIDPFCWWDSVDDTSRPAVDIEAARSGADFAADLVALAEELKHCLADEPGTVGELAAELSEGLPGPLRSQRVLERLLDSPSLPVGVLVDKALLLALGELEGDGR